ncbi:MAG: hypothetical protein PVH88_14355 [Ignavibacteria bacterium]|jgi:hypothetical protein
MLLKAHFNAIEESLLCEAKISANAGHNINIGTPREIFIKKFLNQHLPKTVSIGSGEIIDANSYPGEKRNQVDIVVYRNDFPVLNFGGDINAYLKESVTNIIEVKSTIDKKAIQQAIETTLNSKIMESNLTITARVGYVPPNIQSYLLAYNCEVSLDKVYRWLIEINKELGVTQKKDLPKDRNERKQILNYSLDGIFILGKGFLVFENQPIGFLSDKMRIQYPDLQWIICKQKKGSLLPFFIFLINGISGFLKASINFNNYLKHEKYFIAYGSGRDNNVNDITTSVIPDDSIVIDFSQAFAMWNEEFLMSTPDIILNMEKVKSANENTFLAKLPLYPFNNNREYNFIRGKLKANEELDVIGFYQGRKMDTNLKIKLVKDSQPMQGLTIPDFEKKKTMYSIELLKGKSI